MIMNLFFQLGFRVRIIYFITEGIEASSKKNLSLSTGLWCPVEEIQRTKRTVTRSPAGRTDGTHRSHRLRENHIHGRIFFGLVFARGWYFFVFSYINRKL